jgi:hypothetical protein
MTKRRIAASSRMPAARVSGNSWERPQETNAATVTPRRIHR